MECHNVPCEFYKVFWEDIGEALTNADYITKARHHQTYIQRGF